jgi:hypothetical protein
MITVSGIFGAAFGTLATLWLIVRLNDRRKVKGVYDKTTAARDVTLLVIGSFAGIVLSDAVP